MKADKWKLLIKIRNYKNQLSIIMHQINKSNNKKDKSNKKKKNYKKQLIKMKSYNQRQILKVYKNQLNKKKQITQIQIFKIEKMKQTFKIKKKLNWMVK